MRLKDRVVIVTGGASGIGKSISIKAANEGARVVVADIRETPLEGGQNTVDAILMAGGISTYMNTDVTNDNDVKKLISNTVKKYGVLDVIINNAAAHGRAALLETTEDEWDRVMAVGAKGMFFVGISSVGSVG